MKNSEVARFNKIEEALGMKRRTEKHHFVTDSILECLEAIVLRLAKKPKATTRKTTRKTTTRKKK